MTVRSAAAVEQVVAASDFGIDIREKSKAVARAPAETGGGLRRIHADGDRPDARALEFIQLLFDTP